MTFEGPVRLWRSNLHGPKALINAVKSQLPRFNREGVVAILVDEDRKFILLPSQDEDMDKLEQVLGFNRGLIELTQAMLGLVSGGVHKLEHWEEQSHDAMRREMLEETGFKIQSKDLSLLREHLVVQQIRNNSFYTFYVTVFLLFLTDKQVELIKRQGGIAVTREELKRMLLGDDKKFRPLARAILAQFIENYAMI